MKKLLTGSVKFPDTEAPAARLAVVIVKSSIVADDPPPPPPPPPPVIVIVLSEPAIAVVTPLPTKLKV
jgi:hypothetical protein